MVFKILNYRITAVMFFKILSKMNEHAWAG